ncbi:MAG: mannose-phosphate guanylyltransferase [Patescibacteria group bacterium]|nr:mannose-phosphate guanylyltransferase [Patescibacteria group bacterium]
MKALILAAGLGTRLRPLTEKTPKQLLPVNGKPPLLYHLESLSLFGVDGVLINTHHLSEKIDSFVKGEQTVFPSMTITTTFEPELLGSAGTMFANKTFFDDSEDFLVVYGDNLTDINYKEFFDEHKKKGGLVTIACYYEHHPESKGIINFNDSGKITSFLEKPKKEQVTSNWANAGMYFINKKIFEYINNFEQTPLDFGYHLFPFLLEKGEDMYIYQMSETVLDIGTLESYNEAQSLAKKLFKND